MMRVIQVLKVLSIALLILPLIAAAAGAMYVEGQTTPDDGQMHIMTAEDGLASDGAVPQDSAPMDDGGISLISAMEPSGHTFPWSSMGPPTIPFMDLQAQLIDPSVLITSSPGVAIGHIEPPMIPGYWDNIDMGSLRTNMPVLNISGFGNSMPA
jgi:hypothetical protein